MDTKMQALEKAQNKQWEIISKGGFVDIGHWRDGKFFVVGEAKFEYSEPKPLEKDTLCMCGDGIMRYAMGELDANGRNRFYDQGCCSKNIKQYSSLYSFTHFEVIETPGEFERVQTPDHECINSGCVKYISKWQRVELDKFINGDCEKCTVLIGNPSNLKTQK